MNLPYIKIYDDVLHPGNCQALIEMFEGSQTDQKIRDVNGYIKFTEINLNQNKKWEKIIQSLVSVFMNYYKEYQEHYKIDGLQFPKQFGFEELRMKRYLPNDYDEFKLHVDVTDLQSSKRYLSYLLYLNDVEEGGETTFGNDDSFWVKPKTGRLLMFPPLWTHIHTGKKPISGSKYILTSYNTYC